MDDSGEVTFRNKEGSETPPGSDNESEISEVENNVVLSPCQAGDREHSIDNIEQKLGLLASEVSDSLQTIKGHFETSILQFEKKINDLQHQINNQTANNVNNSGQILNDVRLGSSGLVSAVRENHTGTPYLTHETNESRQGSDSSRPQNNLDREWCLPSNRLKPQTYDGSEDLDEYITHFNIVSEINAWNYSTKSLYLASSLKGPCLSLLNELDPTQCRDYDSVVQALQNRYGTKERAEIFRSKLQSKTQGRSETIPELAQSIRKLTRKAYPSATSEVVDLLALDYFIDALPEMDIRLRLREIGPKTVGEAERIAVRLEAHKVADKTRGRHQVRSLEHTHNTNSTEDNLGKMTAQIKELTNEITKLKFQGNNQNRFNQRYTNSGAQRSFQNNQFDRRRNGPSPFPSNNLSNRNSRQGNGARSNWRTDIRPNQSGPHPPHVGRHQ